MHEVCNEPACRCCHCLSSPRSPKGKEALDTKLKQIVVNILALIVAKDDAAVTAAPGKLNPIIPLYSLLYLVYFPYK